MADLPKTDSLKKTKKKLEERTPPAGASGGALADAPADEGPSSVKRIFQVRGH